MAFLKDLLAGCPSPKEGQYSFHSNDHIRFQAGIDVSGHNHNCNRTILFQNNIMGGEGYTVSIINNDNCHPLWGNNIQMSPKQMRPLEVQKNMVRLRGFGRDRMGTSFSDYAITIYHDGSQINKCVLHMLDRDIEIEYLRE